MKDVITKEPDPAAPPKDYSAMAAPVNVDVNPYETAVLNDADQALPMLVFVPASDEADAPPFAAWDWMAGEPDTYAQDTVTGSFEQTLAQTLEKTVETPEAGIAAADSGMIEAVTQDTGTPAIDAALTETETDGALLPQTDGIQTQNPVEAAETAVEVSAPAVLNTARPAAPLNETSTETAAADTADQAPIAAPDGTAAFYAPGEGQDEMDSQDKGQNAAAGERTAQVRETADEDSLPLSGAMTMNYAAHRAEQSMRAEAPPPPPPVNPAEVIQQVVQAAKLTAAGGLTQLEVQLNPENLGKMQIILTAAPDGAMMAKLRFESDATRALLAQGLQELGTALRSQGFDITRIEIDDGHLRQDFTQDESRDGNREQQQERDGRIPLSVFLNREEPESGAQAPRWDRSVTAAVIPAAPRPVVMAVAGTANGAVEYVS